MVKSSYGEVRPNTKTHVILDMLMRTEGMTVHEGELALGNESLVKHKTVSKLMEYLEDMFGYDVRSFRSGERGRGRGGYHARVHRIVGRWSWNDDYTSYIDPEDYVRRVA